MTDFGRDKDDDTSVLRVYCNAGGEMMNTCARVCRGEAGGGKGWLQIGFLVQNIFKYRSEEISIFKTLRGR